jgi:hypothetical protein
MVGQHLFLNIILSNFIVGIEWKVWCDHGMRARDHYISNTLIGGKGKAGSSTLHTTLEGPLEYVNARWM